MTFNFKFISTQFPPQFFKLARIIAPWRYIPQVTGVPSSFRNCLMTFLRTLVKISCRVWSHKGRFPKKSMRKRFFWFFFDCLPAGVGACWPFHMPPRSNHLSASDTRFRDETIDMIIIWWESFWLYWNNIRIVLKNKDF